MDTDTLDGQHFIYREATTRYEGRRKHTTTRQYKACVGPEHADLPGYWWVSVPRLRAGWVVLPEDALRAQIAREQ